MGIEDATGEMTENVMKQAAAIGRDPSDPAYQQEIQENISKEVRRGSLELAGMEAQGRMGIRQQEASARLGLAGQSTALRLQAGGGLAPQQLGAAGSAQQLMMARGQQGLMNAQAGMAAPMGLMGQFQSLRAAQPSRTTTTPGDPWGAIAGVGEGIAAFYTGGASLAATQGLKKAYEGG